MNIFITTHKKDYNYIKQIIIQWSKDQNQPICLSHCFQLDYSKVHQLLHIHLAIIDVTTPGINCFDFVRYLKKYNQDVDIILLDDSLDNAYQGYEVNAKCYLEKPVNSKKLKNILQQIIHHPPSIYLKTGRHIIKMPYRNILYIQTNNHYCEIKTLTQTLRCHYTMKELKVMFPYPFIQIYRNILLNTHYIHHIYAYQICLVNHEILPISKTYKKQLLDYIETKMK